MQERDEEAIQEWLVSLRSCAEAVTDLAAPCEIDVVLVNAYAVAEAIRLEWASKTKEIQAQKLLRH